MVMYKDADGLYCLEDTDSGMPITRINASCYQDAKDMLIDYGVITEDEVVIDQTGE